VRALLDQQLSPQIAVQLRQAGYDIDAVADRQDLAGRGDRIILEVACSEGRAAVTNNIKDFRALAAEWLAHGTVHAGLILLPSTRTRKGAACPSAGWRCPGGTRLGRIASGRGYSGDAARLAGRVTGPATRANPRCRVRLACHAVFGDGGQ